MRSASRVPTGLLLAGLAGCGGSGDPPAVADFRAAVKIVETGAERGLAEARRILSSDSGWESVKAENQRREAAEQGLRGILQQAHEHLKRADLDALARHPSGRALWDSLLGRCDELARAYDQFAVDALFSFLDDVRGDAESAQELGLGRDEASIGKAVESRTGAIEGRLDVARRTYLEDRLQQARVLKQAGQEAASAAAAQLAQRFLRDLDLEGLENYRPHLDQINALLK
ncbi:MAG: hypothetical protein L0216_05965 [Planctomycetales bacterium]|nr:hypothetical protein [Planctomycetales bacterium]